MTSMIIEALIVAFCVGGALGAIVAMHMLRHYERELLSMSNEEFDGHELKRAEVRVHTRRIK